MVSFVVLSYSKQELPSARQFKVWTDLNGFNWFNFPNRLIEKYMIENVFKTRLSRHCGCFWLFPSVLSKVGYQSDLKRNKCILQLYVDVWVLEEETSSGLEPESHATSYRHIFFDNKPPTSTCSCEAKRWRQTACRRLTWNIMRSYPGNRNRGTHI